MSIDEAIARAREVAKQKYAEGMLCHANPNDENLDGCIVCARDHEQLAEWLEELKARREADRTSDSKPFDVLLAKRYNKAIDDEKDVILQTLDNEILVDTLHLRLEQLKAGGNDEMEK